MWIIETQLNKYIHNIKHSQNALVFCVLKVMAFVH